MLVEQKIAFNLTIDEASVFFTDALLEEPTLLGVRVVSAYTASDSLFTDGATICTLVGYPIYFEWEETPGALFYILQICQHQEFVGPTLVTFNIPSTEVSPFTAGAIYKQIYAGQTIRKEKSYYYRVFAYGNSGEVSPKSEIWGFTFSCDLGDPAELTSSAWASNSNSASNTSGVACNYKDAKFVFLVTSSGSGDVSPPTLKYNVYNDEGQLVLGDVSPTIRLSTSKVTAANTGLIEVDPEDCTPNLIFAFEPFQEEACGA